ncbi:MAG: HEAT repeat domain-containing protein [Planctomycetes bacterium]|nr:HEAT repeat domain-containing protein [Planctomycetota bacterium]
MSGAKLGAGALGVALLGVAIVVLSGGGPAPELVLAPLPTETHEPAVALSGRARGPEGMTLTIGDELLRLGPADPEGWRPYETRATLTEAGAHELVLTLSADGETLKQARATITRIVDVLGIELETPAEGALLSEAHVEIRGRVVGPVDLARSRLLLNDERIEVGSDGSFALQHPVRPGAQTLHFRLQGQQSAELVRTVHYDATAPHVEIYRPTDKFTVRPTLKFVLRAWDESPKLQLKLGELEAELEAGALWTGEVPVPEGESDLTLSVTDPAGNTFTRTLEVERVAPQAIDSKAFLEAFENESSSSGRTRMIRALDPDDEVARLTLIARCLTSLDWNHSQSAVLALSTWTDQATLRTLPGKNAPNVAKNPALLGPLVERVLLALGTAADPENVPVLVSFLRNEHWQLRRGAAAALERIPDARALQPLASAFVQETHPLVKAAFQRALERISRHYEPSPQAWASWASASAHLGDPRAPTNFPDLTDKRLLAKGMEFYVTARGVKGDKLPLVVLPDMGLDVSTIAPYLRALEEERRVIYLQIPFPRETKFNNDFVSYPFRKVAEAMGALLKQLQAQGEVPATGVGLLGAGHGGWLAAMYANADPVMVQRQILVAASPSSQAWFYAVRGLREQWKTSRDMDLLGAGSRLSDPGSKPPVAFNQGGLNAVCKWFSVQFANPRDPEIAHVVGPLVEKDLEGTTYRVYRGWQPLVGYKWRDFNLLKVGENTRTLLIEGELDPFFDEVARETIDAELREATDATFKKRLPWVVELLPGCSRFPWVEQPELFVGTVEAFLDQE